MIWFISFDLFLLPLFSLVQSAHIAPSFCLACIQGVQKIRTEETIFGMHSGSVVGLPGLALGSGLADWSVGLVSTDLRVALIFQYVKKKL